MNLITRNDELADACARLGAALRDHVHRTYSAAVVVPQWEALFQRLCSRRAGRGVRREAAGASPTVRSA